MAGRVSLIITTYNAARYLVQAVESAIDQTYADHEVIVVDDGSTDNTREVMARYHDKVVYLHQENQERAIARNAGLRLAGGAFVSFLDADDVVERNKLAELVDYLEKTPPCDVVYSAMEFFWDDGRRLVVPRPTPSGDILPDLLWHNFITTSVPLFRREVLTATGGFDARWVPVEDWDLCLRASLAGFRFDYLDRLHTRCRVHGSNTTTNFVLMAEKKLATISGFIAAHRAELNRRRLPADAALAYHRADYGKYLMAGGETAKGRQMIMDQSQFAYPGRWKYYLLGALSTWLPERAMVGLLNAWDRSRLKRIH
ncbi:MAG: glycosyltransferase [Acidobacteria bacterium]|nr:glycosyltransferase [Acidobacteriota bacterium]MBI3657902.1 glycosyltransferase [Acidobacteriota bacterium]